MMAPDKIYIHEASAPEMTDKLPYHIEYIRKNAFIKKACEWLANTDFCHYYNKEFIDDFRKAMEE